MKIRISHIGAAALLALASTAAQAVGTAASTPVNNTATVNYQTGGLPQTPINSNTTTFLVDRRVNLTITEVGNAATSTSPGAQDQATEFTVTNLSNAPLDFALAAQQDPDLATTAHGNTDNFDLTDLEIYQETDGTPGFSAGDTLVTFLDEVAADQTVTVYIVGDIPLDRSDGDAAGVTLFATASEPGGVGVLGATVTETAGPDDPNAVDTVLGDGAGDQDAARDGVFSEDDDYVVVAAELTVVKSSRVISDPFNGTTDPKAIPSAVVEYCIEVTNGGTVDATNVTITDSLAAQPVTFVSGSITTGATSCTSADGTSEDDDAIGADEAPDGGSFGADTVTGTFATIPPATTARLRFQVTVD